MTDIDSEQIEAMLRQMAGELREITGAEDGDPLMVGIRTGGVWVANRLHAMLELAEPLGELDINFYRDDFTRVGLQPHVSPSNLPFSVDDRQIILVDDVVHTGRTIRAAMNEIFDYGRPSRILLAALLERGGHDLPIRADVVGRQLQLGDNEHIKLTGPENLKLVVQQPE